MPIRRLTAHVSVSPQVRPGDLAGLACAGFRGVVNNRPDGEADDQPSDADLAAAAACEGLAYRHVPVVSGQYDARAIDAMARALAELPGPVLAFCRTGTRSTALWALQAARRTEANRLVAIAAEAGYDLAALAPRLRALHGA